MARGSNYVRLIGVLTRDPEIEMTKGESPILRWTATVAGEDEVIGNDGKLRMIPWYHRIAVLGKVAEMYRDNGHTAGTAVLVEGSLNYRSWTDPNGNKRSTVEIRPNRLEALDEDLGVTTDSGGGLRGTRGCVNKVYLIGNAGKEAEIKTVSSGDQVAEVRIAVSENWKNARGEQQESTHWIDLAGWREHAAHMQKIGKGTPVSAEGALRNESWKDKTTGEPRNAQRVEISKIMILRGRASAGQSVASGAVSRSAPAESRAASKSAQSAARQAPVEDNIPDEEDLPF